MGNIIGMLENELPDITIQEPEGSKTRNRVFTPRNTLLTMVLTASQEDKTLQNSVNLYYHIHQQHKEQTIGELKSKLEEDKALAQKGDKKGVGRPKKHELKIPKSLEKNISLNTAAYSKARKRLSVDLTNELFEKSRIEKVENSYSHWHGYRVFIGDGTYVQMQDTKSIREKYDVKHNGKSSKGYPQGLLEVLTERGTGQVYNFALANRHVSELKVFFNMLDDVPTKSILLLDDLYNCFEIISKCKRKGIELLVPAKRKRNYEVVETIGQGDEIIRIKTPKTRSKWPDKNEEANTFLLRRLVCLSPNGKEYVLHTTVLDKEISKEELQLLYLTRWDIEVSILEIKTIMHINVLRSKTPEMALKELTVTLATYNLIRKVINTSLKGLHFPPKEDFIQKFYTLNKAILIDKKGRVYNRWSTGRKRTRGTS